MQVHSYLVFADIELLGYVMIAKAFYVAQAEYLVLRWRQSGRQAVYIF